MKMTYADALTVAIDVLTSINQQYIEKELGTNEVYEKAIEKMDALRTTYTNRNANRTPMSDEAKQARKDATAAKRAELVAQVTPVLRKYLSADYRQQFGNEDARNKFGFTAKELYLVAAPELPEGFTAPKVQNILIREMAPELVRTERKKGGDLYRLAD